jgi:hypothetical protein
MVAWFRRIGMAAVLAAIGAGCGSTVETQGRTPHDAGGEGGSDGGAVDGGCPPPPIVAGSPCVAGTTCTVDSGCGPLTLTCTDPAIGWEVPVIGCPPAK